MSTATRLVVVTMTVGLLAGCTVGQDREPTAAPTSSPEVTAPTGEDTDGDAGTVEGEAPAEEIAPDAPQQVADVVAALPAEPLPDIAPAAGTVVTSGPVSVTVPAEYRPAGAFDGVQLFEGPGIRGARSATSGAQVYPPVTDAAWAQRLSESLAPALDGVTSTVYALEVPGADAAVVHVVTDTEGHSARDREGRRVWQAPVTTAHVLVGVGDQVTRVVLQTPPTPEGLDAALSVARTVTVAG